MRETSTVNTSNGYVFEVKKWLNQGEDRILKEFYDKHSQVKVREGVDVEEATSEDFDVQVDFASSPAKIVGFQEMLFDVWVDTVGGEKNTEEVRKSVRVDDFHEVIEFILKQSTEDKKKESLTKTPIGEQSSETEVSN